MRVAIGIMSRHDLHCGENASSRCLDVGHSSLVEKCSSLFRKGFFHIFGANLINKVVAFATNIAIVWFLTKDDYGIFGYANNIYSIAVLITGFGLLTGMLQFCLEKRPSAEKDAIFRYSLTRGILVDLVIVLCLLFVGLVIPLPIEQAGRYLALFGPLILLSYLFEYASTVLRIKFENQKYAILQNINTIAYFVFACFGAYLGGIAGTILARYIAFVVSIGIALVFLKSSSFSLGHSHKLSASQRRSLWTYSIPTQFSWALNQLTYLLDVLLVGLFIHNAADVASYKVATMLPEGLLFIPSSIIVFALPFFIKHNHDRAWFIAKSSAYLRIGGLFFFLISLLLIVFAPWIIELLWGVQYLDATTVFRLLAASFAFSAIRSTCTHLLCAVRAVKENLAISVFSVALNVLLCLLLIPKFGINGAAVAPLAVSIVTCAIACVALIRTIVGIKEG